MNTFQQSSADLTPQNPWPGLRAFTESDSNFFFGRKRETAELLDLVKRSPVVVLYGQSGLGKTSLLQAGLFPGLKREDFLPIHLRFDQSDGAPSLADQVKIAISSELDAASVTGPLPSPGETLWEYFHRHDVDLWGPRNRLLTPVIVLDQFEEVFTLGQRSAEAANRVSQFAEELEALLEHRPPDAVRERLEAHPDDAQQYDLRRQGVKFVVALREDFLADLDPWRVRMPSLLPNRFRLEPMTGAQALEVVKSAGGDLIEHEVARGIVEFVSTSRRMQTAREMEQRDVQPAILSVVCDELNRRRIERDQSKITADLLSGEREGIIRSFYERSFEGVDPRVRNWVEDELLTDSGYRDRAALEDALRQGLPAGDFDQLVNRRILHREERSGVVWLELTHDLLTDPASESRLLREQRRQAEAAKRQAEDAEKQKEKYERDLRKSRILTGVFGLLLIGAGIALYFAVVGNRLANLRETERERSFQAAGDMAERLSFGIGGGWVPKITVFQIIFDTKHSYDQLLNDQATHSRDEHVRLVQHYARFLAKSADARYQVGYFKEGLEDAQAALKLLKGLSTLESADGLIQVTLAESTYEEGYGYLANGQIDLSKRDFENAANLTASPPNSDPIVKRDIQRVSILSQIGLGQTALQRLDYDEARLQFKRAINSIAANGSNSDEALSWRVSALMGSGLSEWDDKLAQKEFGEAFGFLHPIVAPEGSNPQLKRLLAELFYDQGLASMGLGQFDTARNYFEQSKNMAEDLFNRDPENLQWRLDLLQAWRGLGLVHQNMGEWDTSQESLKHALELANDLTGKQSSWAQARFLQGALVMGLGKIAETRYSMSSKQGQDSIFSQQVQDPKDLASASGSFKESLGVLQKGAGETPKYLEFTRYVSLALSEQGGLSVLQGDASKPTEDKSSSLSDRNERSVQIPTQDKSKQFYMQALDFYSQAFKALEPIEGSPAKESPEILRDKANFFKLTAVAHLRLKQQQQAISSYLQSIQIHKDLVKRAPSPDSYRLLSSVLVALGDIFRDAQDFKKASSQYTFAMEAIAQALRDQPENSNFLNLKSVIQSRFSDISRRGGDLVTALKYLETAFPNLLTALKTDYSDSLLNDNLDYYREVLDKIDSSLQDSKEATGSQQSRLTSDQIKELRARVATLKTRSDPTLLLDHYGQVPWSLPPMLPGTWRTLGGDERTTALVQLLTVNKSLRQDQVRGMRKLSLDFYDDGALYELEVTAGTNRDGIVSVVQRGKDWKVLDGSATPILELNRTSPPKLDTPERAIAYLRFYLGAIQFTKGTFVLIDQTDDILWLKTASDTQRKGASEKIKPLILESSPDGEWQAIGTLEFSGDLFDASFRLSRAGVVNIVRDRNSYPNLPIYIGSYCAGIRLRTTMQALPQEKAKCDLLQAEQKLAQNPNSEDVFRQLISLYAAAEDWEHALEKLKNWLAVHSTDRFALQELPFVLSRMNNWKEAIETEKHWISFVLREDKDDPDRRAILLNAYLGLSWDQLFVHDFAGALATSETGKKLNESDLHIDTNRAHALLFLGRIAEADAIYLGNRGKKMDAESDQTWDQVILQDFDDLEKGGVSLPEFARLRRALQQQKVLQPQNK
jgi:tetratricopeptide (TPR) repeat protein